MNSIIKASIKNAKELEKLFKQLHLSQFRRGEIKRAIESEEKEYFILNSNNNHVGALSLFFTPENFEIDGLSVIEKRKGYGKYLIDFAKTYAFELGADKLIVQTMSYYNALEFYRLNNFYIINTEYDKTRKVTCFTLETNLN